MGIGDIGKKNTKQFYRTNLFRQEQLVNTTFHTKILCWEENKHEKKSFKHNPCSFHGGHDGSWLWRR